MLRKLNHDGNPLRLAEYIPHLRQAQGERFSVPKIKIFYYIRSQQAIERLGAKKDGMIRGFEVRRDDTVRDTVFYSMTAVEWAENKVKLLETV